MWECLGGAVYSLKDIGGQGVWSALEGQCIAESETYVGIKDSEVKSS
jgi:hypothetical protein